MGYLVCWFLILAGAPVLVGQQAIARTSSSSEGPLSARLEQVRGQIANGWWIEARDQLAALLATPEGRAELDVWLLKAEVCYHTLDVRGAYQALEAASSLASPAQLDTVKRLAALMDSRLGVLELRVARVIPIRLELQVPLLDPHLHALFEVARDALAGEWIAGGDDPSATSPIEWFDPGSGQALPSRPPGAAGARLYLPAGHYRVSGVPIEIEAARSTSFALQQDSADARPHLTLTAGYLQTGSPGSSIGPLESIASLEAATAGGWLGGRLLLGVWLDDDPTVGADVSRQVALRPVLRLGVFIPIDLTRHLRAEPNLSTTGLILPYQQFSCTATAISGEGVTARDTCYDDAWAWGAGIGLRLAVHPDRPSGWIVHLEGDIGGMYAEALHTSWTDGGYRVDLEQPWSTRALWTVGMRTGWTF